MRGGMRQWAGEGGGIITCWYASRGSADETMYAVSRPMSVAKLVAATQTWLGLG